MVRKTPDGLPYLTPDDTPDPEATRKAMESIPDSGPELIQPGDEAEPGPEIVESDAADS